jgi:hypothetical protein
MRLKYDNEYHAPTGRGMDKLSISQGVALGYKYKAPPGLEILRFAQNDNYRSDVILRRPTIGFSIWHTPFGRQRISLS